MNPYGYGNFPPRPMFGQNWIRRTNVAEFGQVPGRKFHQSNQIIYGMNRRPERNYHNWRTKGWKGFDYRRYNRRGYDLDDVWRPNYDDVDDDNDNDRPYPNRHSQYPCYNNRSISEYPNNYSYQQPTPTWSYGSYHKSVRYDTYRNHTYRDKTNPPQQSNFNNSWNINIIDKQNSSYSDVTTNSSNRSSDIDSVDSVVPITENHSENNKICDDGLLIKLSSLHDQIEPQVTAGTEREDELLPNLEVPMQNILDMIDNTNNNNASSNISAGAIANTHGTIDMISQSYKRLENSSMQQKRYHNINFPKLKQNSSFLPPITTKDNVTLNTNTTITIQLSSFESREVVNLQSNNEELAPRKEKDLVANSNVSDKKHSCKEAESHTTDSSEIIIFNNSISSPPTSSNQNNIEILPDKGEQDCPIMFLREKLQLKSQKIGNGTQTSSGKLIKKHGLNTRAVSVSSPIDTEAIISDSSGVLGANLKQNGKLRSDVSLLNSSSCIRSTSNPSSEDSSCSATMQNSRPPVEVFSEVNHNTTFEYSKSPNENGTVCESKTAHRKISKLKDCENSVDIHNNQGKREYKKLPDKIHCDKKNPTKPLNELNTIRKHSKTAEERRNQIPSEHRIESSVNNNQLVLSKERETGSSSSNKNVTKSTASATSPIDNLRLRKITNRRKTIAHVDDDNHVADNENRKQLEVLHHKKVPKASYDADICNNHIQKRRKTEESRCVKLNGKVEFPKRENDSTNAKEALLLEKKTFGSNKNQEPSVVEKVMPLKAHKRRKTISEWSIESSADNRDYPSSLQHKTHSHNRKSRKPNEGTSNKIVLKQHAHGDVDSSVGKGQRVPLERCNNSSNKTNEDNIVPVAKKVPILKIINRRHTITQQVEEEIEESSVIFINESVSSKTRPHRRIQARRKSIIVSPEKDNVSLNINKRKVSTDSNKSELSTGNGLLSLLESDSDSDLSTITCRSSSSERKSKHVQPQPHVPIENCLADESLRKSQHSSNRSLASKTATEENVMIPLKEYVLPAHRKSDNKLLDESECQDAIFVKLFGPDNDENPSRKSRGKRLRKKSVNQNEPDIPWKLKKVDDYISSIKHAHKSTCEEVNFETAVELIANDELEIAKCSKVQAELDTSALPIITQEKVYSDAVVIKQQPCNYDSEIDSVNQINNLMQMHCSSSDHGSNSRKSAEQVVCTPDLPNSRNCSQQPARIQPSPTLTLHHDSEELDAVVAEISVSRRSSRLGNIKITPLRKLMSTSIATPPPTPSTIRQISIFSICATYDDFCHEMWKDIFFNLKNSEMIIKQANYFSKIGYERNGALSHYYIAWSQSVEALATRISKFFSERTVLPNFSYKACLKHCYYYGDSRGNHVTLPSMVKLMFVVVTKIKNARSHLDGFIKEFSAMAEEEYQNNHARKAPTQLDQFLISCNLLAQPPKPSVGSAGENASRPEVTHNPVHDSTRRVAAPTNENELVERRTNSKFTLAQADLFLRQMEQYRFLIKKFWILMNAISKQRYGPPIQQEQSSYSSSRQFQAGVTVHQYPSQMCIQPPPQYPSQNLPTNPISSLNSFVHGLGRDSQNTDQNLTHTSYVASSNEFLPEFTEHLERPSPITDINDNFRIRLPLSVPRTDESVTITTPPNTPEFHPLSETVISETAGVNRPNGFGTEISSNKSQTGDDDNKDLLWPIFPFYEDEVIDVEQWFREKMRQQDFIDLDDYDEDEDPSCVDTGNSGGAADPGRVDVDPGRVDAGPSRVDADPSRGDAEPSRVDADPGRGEAGPSYGEAGPSRVDAGPSRVDEDPSRVDVKHVVTTPKTE